MPQNLHHKIDACIGHRECQMVEKSSRSETFIPKKDIILSSEPTSMAWAHSTTL